MNQREINPTNIRTVSSFMISLITAALTCQLSTMNKPEFYTANIAAVNSQGKSKLTLTYTYYGAALDYKYILIQDKDQLSGKDKKGVTVVVKNIKKTNDREYSLTIESSKEGRLQMNCSSQ